ncbi:hypothetical protein GCM10022226_67620 [Sphaerisporangium flaviroseum]|uniref:Glycosyl transferase family 1 domain-containing protein n=1 Tax=Sphaerisporangium flaviroseum TaxID=509199 RepID=A0ABP7J757_9ACTN
MKIRYMLLHAYGMGGTIRTVINQANHMVAAGHDVEIVSVVRRRKNPHFSIDPRITVTSLADQRGGVTRDSLSRRVYRRLRGKVVPAGEFAASYFTERVEKAVIDYVSSLDDGILVTTRPALNLISARHAPEHLVRVAQEHMNLSTHKDDVREQVVRHYSRLDAVVVLTETDRADYQRILPRARVRRIPNAVDGLGQGPPEHRDKIVIAAGRLYWQKGFDLLIPAFEEVARDHPGWRLLIYGTGPKKEELQTLIDEHGLHEHVSLMGRSSHFDRELARASVFVLSSRFEGLPMVMIEAMSHALAIVSFDCPTGPGDVITHEVDGLLVPPEDIGGLAGAMNRLIADPELRRRLGAEARTAVRRYSPAEVMPAWESLFTELLKERAGRPGTPEH